MPALQRPWLAACLLGCLSACSGSPAGRDASLLRIQSKEAYRSQARLAMVSYQAIDPCLRDAAAQARMRLSQWDSGSTDGISLKISALLDKPVAELSQHPVAVRLFE